MIDEKMTYKVTFKIIFNFFQLKCTYEPVYIMGNY